jgi:hypothetical protein
LGHLVRFVLLPGHRFDTVGVAPPIDGIALLGVWMTSEPALALIA